MFAGSEMFRSELGKHQPVLRRFFLAFCRDATTMAELSRNGKAKLSRKRKASAEQELAGGPSGDEFESPFVDAALSHSDSGSEAEEVDSELGASDDANENGDESDEEEELDSEEIPFDDGGEDEVREQLRKLKTHDGRKSASENSRVANALANSDTSGDEAQDAHEDDELRPNYTVTQDANGNPRYMYCEIDPVYDSDESDAPATNNTIGNIPLSYYDEYPHIGYDINGKKIMRPAKGEALDALLDSIDVPKGWTGLTDPATGKPLQLSQDELDLLRKVAQNESAEDGYDPYPEMIPYFSGKLEVMPLSAAPEPKRRFVPSRHEAKRIMKIARAIQQGRIQPYRPPPEHDDDDVDVKTYDLWADEAPRPAHVMHIPAPKLPPPGYDESYHPPPEYLPDKDEQAAWREADEEDREKDYLPTDHDALRRVPGYERFVKDKFERCLDLYLAPRVRRNKLNIDPESLLPKLPSPDELRPFPTTCAAIFRGHRGRVRCVAVDPRGDLLASGGDDGYLRLWELLTGRQLWHARLADDDAVDAVRWRPAKDTAIVAAAAGERVFLAVPVALVGPDVEQRSRDVLDAGWGYAAGAGVPPAAADARKEPAARWTRPGARLEERGVLVQIAVRSPVKALSWHRRGDYFATVAPRGQSAAVAVHTLSKHLSQLPFRRLRGLAQAAHFHPAQPVFFVATKHAIRSYDLARQTLAKTLRPGAKWISSFDVHPGGDNVVVGTYDRRLLWHDLDLSPMPYKTLRYHSQAIRAVRFHPGGLPLFADASDDGTLQVFHGSVVGDLLENATIVPLKVLRGHQVKSRLGVMDVDWHPREPWCVSAGADGTCRLWC